MSESDSSTGSVTAQPEATPVAIPTPGQLRVPAPASPTPVSTPAVSGAPRITADPARWGRIAADGTAYLRTPEGEVVIGQWAAGTPEEGLAFFGRKYEDLVVEVDLARTRLIDGRGTSEQAAAAVAHVRAAVLTPMFMGDVAALLGLCDEVDGIIARAAQDAERRRAEQREMARAQREAIVVEAESLAESTRWKHTGERFAQLLEAWQAAPHIDRASEQSMWKRFSRARSTFDRARRTHFAEREVERKATVAAKERLITEAEKLSGSRDWAETTREYRRLMDRWKSAGHAGRGAEDALWGRFRAAQDAFFAARDAANADRDAEERANLERKEALVVEAEALVPIGDIGAAKRRMREIADRWDAVGHVPRADRERIDKRLRRVEEALRNHERDEWRRTNPETRARAVDTVGKFRDAIARAERDRDAALARGDAKAAEAAEESIVRTQALLEAAEGTLSELSR